LFLLLFLFSFLTYQHFFFILFLFFFLSFRENLEGFLSLKQSNPSPPGFFACVFRRASKIWKGFCQHLRRDSLRFRWSTCPAIPRRQTRVYGKRTEGVWETCSVLILVLKSVLMMFGLLNFLLFFGFLVWIKFLWYWVFQAYRCGARVYRWSHGWNYGD
jgi:hypothetical protein